MKAKAPKMPGGSKMGGFKFANGGSANEAMRPSTPPDPAVEASIRNAPAEAERKRRQMVAENAARRAAAAEQVKARLAQPRPGMKKGGSVSSASKRADGCATKGKTKGRFV
jgi:outer membrane protein TolC